MRLLALVIISFGIMWQLAKISHTLKRMSEAQEQQCWDYPL